MKRNLLYPLLFAVLCGAFALLIGVQVHLSMIDVSLLATTLYFCCLFLRELRMTDLSKERQLSEALQIKHQAILDKLTMMDEKRQALSVEIDTKIARIINENIEKLVLNHTSNDLDLSLASLEQENLFKNETTQRAFNEQWEPAPHSVNDERSVRETYSMKPAPQGNPRAKKPSKSFMARDMLLDTIRAALKTDSIETLLQPIVSLPQRKKRFFEATSRLRRADHQIILPEDYILLAEEHALIRIIDNAILMKCIYLARSSSKKDLNVGFFLNLSLKTLEDSEFIDSLREFIEINQAIVDRFVFCLEADDMKKAGEKMLRTIKGLCLLGCQFALTHVNSFDFDFGMLRDYKVQFLKIHQEVLSSYLKENSVEDVKHFKHKAYMHQIDLVVTHVETEDQLKSILDFECDFGQGYLFALPQAIENLTKGSEISSA